MKCDESLSIICEEKAIVVAQLSVVDQCNINIKEVTFSQKINSCSIFIIYDLIVFTPIDLFKTSGLDPPLNKRGCGRRC